MRESSTAAKTDPDDETATATHIVIREIAGLPVKVGDLVDCTGWNLGRAEHFEGERRLRPLPTGTLEEEARKATLRLERAVAAIDRDEAAAREEFAAIERRQAEIRKRSLELLKYKAEADELEREEVRIGRRLDTVRNVLEERIPARRGNLEPMERRAGAYGRAAAAQRSKAS